jgi:hypothetical protein
MSSRALRQLPSEPGLKSRKGRMNMMPLSAPSIKFMDPLNRPEVAHRAHHYTEEEWKKITVSVLCRTPLRASEC